MGILPIHMGILPNPEFPFPLLPVKLAKLGDAIAVKSLAD